MTTFQVAPEERVILYDVSWETYERLLADHIDRSVPHFTYDRGALEISRPSLEREQINRTLTLLVEVVAEEFEIDLIGVGSMTYRRKALARGFEADSSFYIQPAERIRGVEQVDPEIDPPPDLIIDINVTNDAPNKLPTFAALSIPEVWRYDRGIVTIHALRTGTYERSVASLALPLLTGEVLTRFVGEGQSLSSLAWLRAVRDWARTQVAAAKSPQ